ncbi:hypothetical protein FVE85_7776 [Porphyridium purpureum]|uniref:Potassium channel tetramerisation-type BTB domain-containing protein n=1 Tax=Porphyridium purpureum TaxID=35688 RepID=A0A5J4YJN6_PORPP|nr:hypothetical protein FVE85_7776 [Porphyridium purpureum]|eukprot:POR8359..scf210_14
MDMQDAVRVNVGGVEFVSSTKSLCRYESSRLAQCDWNAEVEMDAGPMTDHMSSAEAPDSELVRRRGRRKTWFFDRDPDVFKLVLEFLRTEAPATEFVPPQDERTRKRLLAEARYFRLPELETLLLSSKAGESSNAPRSMDVQALAPVAPQVGGSMEGTAQPLPPSVETHGQSLTVTASPAEQTRYSRYVVLVFERVVIMANDKPIAGYYVINGKQSSIESEGWFSSFELESLHSAFRVAVSHLLQKHVDIGYRIAHSSSNVSIVRAMVRSDKKQVDYQSCFVLTTVMER